MEVKNILTSVKDSLEHGKMTMREAGEVLCRAGWFNYMPSCYDIIKLVHLKRYVKKSWLADEKKPGETLGIFCSGGYPHIGKLTLEVWHEGENGCDFAKIAFIKNNEPEWRCDADLLTDAEREQVIQMCKNYK